jgi:hypothetical protein
MLWVGHSKKYDDGLGMMIAMVRVQRWTLCCQRVSGDLNLKPEECAVETGRKRHSSNNTVRKQCWIDTIIHHVKIQNTSVSNCGLGALRHPEKIAAGIGIADRVLRAHLHLSTTILCTGTGLTLQSAHSS